LAFDWLHGQLQATHVRILDKSSFGPF